MLNQTYADVIAKAHEKGIAIIVMNPVGGGMLAEDSPVVKSALRESLGTEDLVGTAHRYLAGNNNIDTILCGINKPSDIISTLENYRKPPLTKDEIAALEKAMQKLSSTSMGFCTNCQYCLPCPADINIPAMMNVSYHEKLLKVPLKAKDIYNWTVSELNQERSAVPSLCTQCGQCEEKCTQKLKIIPEIKWISERYQK
jgi:predicted aldo/keto reductase-like oxidoreductase